MNTNIKTAIVAVVCVTVFVGALFVGNALRMGKVSEVATFETPVATTTAITASVLAEISTKAPTSLSLPQNLTKDLLNTDNYRYDLVQTDKGVNVVPAHWIPDIQTLARLDQWYYADKNTVYSTNGQTKFLDRMTYADRATFTVLASDSFSQWAKDKNYVYDFGNVVMEADPASFNTIGNSRYVKDKTHVFFGMGGEYSGLYSVVKGADPVTFSAVDNPADYSYDAQDEQHKYYKGEILLPPTPDVAVGKIVPNKITADPRFSTDGQRVYVYGDMIIGADPATFTPLPYQDDQGYVFSKDEAHVYFSSADSNSYLLDPTSIISGADPATFIVLGSGYAKDHIHAYFYDNVVPQSDPGTFALCEDINKGAGYFVCDAHDKNRKYQYGKVVQ